VQSAQLYENFAELVLAPGSRSEVFFQEVAGKLAIRKFEMSQPSLNAIFLRLVGGV
jgi:ABC-type uncharacterized transport system ATPase subunit